MVLPAEEGFHPNDLTGNARTIGPSERCDATKWPAQGAPPTKLTEGTGLKRPTKLASLLVLTAGGSSIKQLSTGDCSQGAQNKSSH